MLRKKSLNIKCTPLHRSPCIMNFIFLPMEAFVLWHKLKFTNSYLGSISNIQKVIKMFENFGPKNSSFLGILKF